MRRLLLLVPVLLLTTPLLAVAPRFWRLGSAEEFLAGEVEGFAVTSRGELTPAPAATKLVSFDDPFVLSQAEAANGDRFFGTGNDGKVYRLRGGQMKVLFTAGEPEVYAVAFRDGALYAGSSPNGKVYRIDPESGKHSVFFDPAQAYIWAIAPVPGGLVVGTGTEGKLFRVDAKGTGTVLYDSADTHVRSVAALKDGSVLAGGSGKGRIYRIGPQGTAHALFESPLNEISAIHVDERGVAWAAGVSNVLPSAPPKAQPKPAQQQQSTTGAAAADKKEEATATVEVGFSFEEAPSTSPSAQSGTSELYRIEPDGFVQAVRKFEREMVYALGGTGGSALLVGTGPNGRVYSLEDRELSLLASVPEKQVVSVTAGPQLVITTTNAGAVYRLDPRGRTASEFRSAARDAERFARFGEYRIEGRNLERAAVSISFRSGNTQSPDSTWSAWSASATGLEGKVVAPAGRYVQWKLAMSNAPADAAVDSVTTSYMHRNVAPVIDVLNVLEPAVVFISSTYPASPMLVEATNPDQYGIFSSLDTPQDRAAEQGKRAFRKGFRTITWRASDENGDDLRYTVSFRQKGSGKWLRLRENLDATQINFDTSQLPDGRYELRLTASDAGENPDAPLTTMREGVEFEIDNSAPNVEVAQSGEDIVLRIRDEISPVGKVEYSMDAEKWIPLLPEDGIADSRDETFRLRRADVAGKFVVVRAVDGSYNVATRSVPAR